MACSIGLELQFNFCLEVGLLAYPCSINLAMCIRCTYRTLSLIRHRRLAGRWCLCYRLVSGNPRGSAALWSLTVCTNSGPRPLACSANGRAPCSLGQKGPRWAIYFKREAWFFSAKLWTPRDELKIVRLRSTFSSMSTSYFNVQYYQNIKFSVNL